MLKKMDQGIAKKILEGLDGINEEELCNITSNILDQWKEDNKLIPQEEQSWFSSVKNYICENVPFIASIQNFWVNGGVHYTKEKLEEQYLVKRITKEIFKTAYISGKEAIALNKDDIYNHFKEIGAYKDNTLSKEMDVVQNQWLNNNYDAWDVSYFNDDDMANLIGEDNE